MIDTVAQTHAWFRPMLQTIVEKRFVRSSLGQKLRLTKENLTNMMLGSSGNLDRPWRDSDSSTESIVLLKLSKLTGS